MCLYNMYCFIFPVCYTQDINCEIKTVKLGFIKKENARLYVQTIATVLLIC